MPLLSTLARHRKARHFLDPLPAGSRVLEVGAGSGWVRDHLHALGRGHRYVGCDITPPADVVGDIREWRSLGLESQSFDAVVAFEVLEHVDCLEACHALLKPGGSLLVTTPLPSRDHVLERLERLGLNQPRTSAHDHLVDLAQAHSPFRSIELRIVGGLSQWARLTA